jgi:outer membrane protein assembly factor BamD
MLKILGAQRRPKTAGRHLTAVVAALAMIGAGTVLSACSTSKEGTRAAYADDAPAGDLYNKGLAYMNAGDLTAAVKAFNEVDRQHPYSEWARKALIMSAYASYKKGKFDDTIQTANRYVTLYPGTEDAPYAQYLIAQSHYNRIPDVTRDQAQTEEALAALEAIVDNYPESEYAEDARKKVIQSRDQLAGKEMQVGRYYLERREYIAAAKRFRYVVENYSNTRHVEEALARLTETYYAMGLTSEAQAAAAVLGHNYPDSQWYKDSYALLQSGGLEPRESAGSWLSNAAKLFGGDSGA